MRKLSLPMVIVVIGVLVSFGYGSKAFAQAKQKNGPVVFKYSRPGTDAPPPAGAVRGGYMREIRQRFPTNLGYPPDWAPQDTIFALPVSERLIDWDAKGNLIPWLAESWEMDPQKATVTFHLRRGIRFHDGTPFNAEAVKWNFQLRIDTKSQYDGELVKSVEVLDEYTVRLICTEITSWSAYIYGWDQMISPTAYTKNGGKEWARANCVGTGPFKEVEFKRDSLIRYERNKDYWRKGYPLLDGFEIRYVPDLVTASMLMESKQADQWTDVNNAVKSVLDLEKKGLKVNWAPGMFYALLPADAKDPKSPYANKKVREAVEYAIDRPAVAKSIGFGKYEAMNQIVPSNSPAYVKGYDPRPYNPDKAKQLLTEAGYPNGFETKLLSLETTRDAAVAIQSYLNAVGIRTQVDLADGGRYAAAIFSPTGWTDLVLAASGINPDSTDILVHFGPRPWTYRFGFIAKSPEFLAACEKALHTYDVAGFRAALQQAARLASEDAMVIPLWRSAQAGVMWPWVHTDYPRVHIVTWYSHQDWMEKRK